jgi:hypothetical protein
MDNHALMLINHDYVIIFIDNVYGDVFRQHVHFCRLGQNQLNCIAAPKPIVSLGRRAINQHISCRYQLLRSAAG